MLKAAAPVGPDGPMKTDLRQDSDEITAATTNASNQPTPTSPGGKHVPELQTEKEVVGSVNSGVRLDHVDKFDFAKEGDGTRLFPRKRAEIKNPLQEIPPQDSAPLFDSPGERKMAQTPPWNGSYYQQNDYSRQTQPPSGIGGVLEKSLSRTIPAAESTTDAMNVDSNLDDVELAESFGLDEPFGNALALQEDEFEGLTSLGLPSILKDAETYGQSPGVLAQVVDIHQRTTQDNIEVHPSSVASSSQSRSTRSTVDGASLSNTPPLHVQYFPGQKRRGTPKTVSYSAIGSLDNIPGSLGKVYTTKTGVRDFVQPATKTLIPPATRDNPGQPPLISQNRPSTAAVGEFKKRAQTERTSVEEAARRLERLKTSPADSNAGSGMKVPRKTSLVRGDKPRKKGKKSVRIDQRVEEFVPSCEAYTPFLKRKKFEYKPAEMRTPVQKMSSTMGTLARPNFRDALRRVAMILRQHIEKIELRFENPDRRKLLFDASMKEAFYEDNFLIPRYKCNMVRVPMARPSTVYALKKIETKFTIPTEEEIYDFGHQLFKSVQLSSECSIVCLIYVERLMEVAKVPLLASTWRPIFMCGLLLASKVWQDLASWNIEFSGVYPQYSLDAINKLELEFLRMVKWDLYISSSLYAKYYFALRSIVEKKDFRQRYNRMVGGVGSVTAFEAKKVEQRTELLKEEAINQLSRSM